MENDIKEYWRTQAEDGYAWSLLSMAGILSMSGVEAKTAIKNLVLEFSASTGVIIPDTDSVDMLDLAKRFRDRIAARGE